MGVQVSRITLASSTEDSCTGIPEDGSGETPPHCICHITVLRLSIYRADLKSNVFLIISVIILGAQSFKTR